MRFRPAATKVAKISSDAWQRAEGYIREGKTYDIFNVHEHQNDPNAYSNYQSDIQKQIDQYDPHEDEVLDDSDQDEQQAPAMNLNQIQNEKLAAIQEIQRLTMQVTLLQQQKVDDAAKMSFSVQSLQAQNQFLEQQHVQGQREVSKTQDELMRLKHRLKDLSDQKEDIKKKREKKMKSIHELKELKKQLKQDEKQQKGKLNDLSGQIPALIKQLREIQDQKMKSDTTVIPPDITYDDAVKAYNHMYTVREQYLQKFHDMVSSNVSVMSEAESLTGWANLRIPPTVDQLQSQLYEDRFTVKCDAKTGSIIPDHLEAYKDLIELQM